MIMPDYYHTLWGASVPETRGSITYATKSIHQRLKLPTTIYEPVVKIQIVNKSSKIQLKKVIPLKSCFNLKEGSVLTTLEKTGSQLYPDDPSAKNKLFLTTILCKKNPELEGNTFQEQLSIIKNEFYENAHHWIDTESGDTLQELIDAGIIKRIGSSHYAYTTGKNAAGIHNPIITGKNEQFNHGPNGCMSDEKLINMSTNK